jgi:hypothetical protein
VYLLAPSIPNPLPWLIADSGAASDLAAMVISFDPSLGLHLQLLSNDPAEREELLGIWLSIFFTNRSGEFAAGTPFRTALGANYVSNEALVVTLQLFGSSGFSRPSVNPGIFSKAVQKCFQIVSFSEDLAVLGENLLQEHQNLADFLTGNAQTANVVFIDDPDAVHDMFIVNPTEVAKTITSCK